MRANLDPHIWGSGAWAFLHHCVDASDVASTDAYVRFLQQLGDVLPCETCREHTHAYLAANSLESVVAAGAKLPGGIPRALHRWLTDFRTAIARREAGPVGVAGQGGWDSLSTVRNLRIALVVLVMLLPCVVLLACLAVRRRATMAARG